MKATKQQETEYLISKIENQFQYIFDVNIHQVSVQKEFNNIVIKIFDNTDGLEDYVLFFKNEDIDIDKHIINRKGLLKLINIPCDKVSNRVRNMIKLEKIKELIEER